MLQERCENFYKDTHSLTHQTLKILELLLFAAKKIDFRGHRRDI